jgi:hypothetical protein
MDTPENPESPQVPAGAEVAPPMPPPLESPYRSIAPRQPFPTWKQALITFFGGIVLAATSCVGFLASLGGNFEHGGNDFWSPATAILFCAGLLAIFVGFVFLIMRTARAMMEKKGPVR